MDISKEDKNYFRVLLKDISERQLEKPIALAGKYQFDVRYEYATFTNIRLLLSFPYSKTKIICDHLNIIKNEIDNWYMLIEEDDKKKFYFIGYPVEYISNGEVRYGFKLARKLSFPSFGELSERSRYQEMMDKECSSLNDWAKNNMTETNMGILRKNGRN